MLNISLGRGKKLQAGITAACLTAFILFGYDQGVMGGILQNEDFLAQFGHPGDVEIGFIVSSYNLGCLVGCVSRSSRFCGVFVFMPDTDLHTVNLIIGEKLGRRKALWLSLILIIIGAVLQTCAYNTAHLIVGRVVCGFGTGLKTSTVPMYVLSGSFRHEPVCSLLLSANVGKL